MGTVRADKEFELHPDRMIVANADAMVEVVLEPDFREFAWVISQIGRETPASGSIGVAVAPENAAFERFIVGLLAGDVIAAKGRHPAFAKAVSDLRIDTVIE